MKNIFLRSLLILLLALALLNWISLPNLTIWMLSIFASQMGLWLALISAVVLVFLLRNENSTKIKIALSIATAFTIISFLAPLIAVLKRQSQWQAEMTEAFGATAHPGRAWSLQTQLLGRGEAKTKFTREIFNREQTNEPPLNLDRYSPSAGAKPSPWILVIHGGGWDSGNSDQLPELNSHLNALGYTVFSIDYRLAPTSRWPAPKEDVLRATAFIRAHASEWNIEASRWVILGRSAGGQIATAVAYSLHGEERPQGVISFYGPTDMSFGYDAGDEDDILHSRGLIRAYMGGTPEDQADLYKTASPMNLATNEACPTLLIHGVRDTLVWIKHTERLNAHLKFLGIKEAALVLPWGPHGFDFFFNGPEAQAATAAIEHFLEKVLPLLPQASH